MTGRGGGRGGHSSLQDRLEWTKKQLRRLYDETSQHEEFQILLPLKEFPSDVDAGAQVDETVQRITDRTRSVAETMGENKRELGNHLYYTVFSLLQIVSYTPRRHQARLVDFLVRLQQVRLYETPGGPPLLHDGHSVWTELPTFGYTLADEWQYNVHRPDQHTDMEMEAWENTHAYIAQVTAAINRSGNAQLRASWDYRIGPVSHALWDIRDAFETFEDPRDIPPIAARTAGVWLLYMARELWMAAVAFKELPEQRGRPGPRYEAEGWRWKGHNRQRWDIWKQTLENSPSMIQIQGEEGRETRSLMHDALQSMLQAEETTATTDGSNDLSSVN